MMGKVESRYEMVLRMLWDIVTKRFFMNINFMKNNIAFDI